MNILFINANLHGHINPTLGLVEALAKGENKVSYFCSEAFLEQIKKVGAEWIGYSGSLNLFLKTYHPTDKHPFYMLMEYMLLYDEVMLPEILTHINDNQYDMVICDSYFGGACFLQQMVEIPVVCSHSSFAMSKAPLPERMLQRGFHPQLDHCYEIIKRISKRYGIKGPSIEQVFTSKGKLNIVYTSCDFNGDDMVCEPDYLFVGPAINRPQEVCNFDFSMIGARKLIYISLGSTNTDFIDFYKTCIAAFRDTGYYVCMSIGRKSKISEIGEIPSNFFVKSYLPQLAILERADVFITHAGFNSVNEALYYGVPMLAFPQVNDQHMVAKRLTSLQLGMSEDMKELTKEKLRLRTETLMNNENIKDNCIHISKEMRRSRDLDQAIMKLIKYVDDWKGKKKGVVKE